MNKLEQIIRDKIISNGDMPIDEFMELALYHPEYGYYTNNYPIGAEGDFITSPEISQIFGEIIAIFFLNKIHELPEGDIALVEIGAGKGTLMKDILRTFSQFPEISERIKPYIIEINPKLRELQSMALDVTHIESIEELPSLPCIIYANEFFDCLPIKQFHNENEVKVTITNGELTRTSDEITLEESQGAEGYYSNICEHIKENKGLGLFIDYGYFSGSGDTLQAIQKHKKASIFHDIGDTDLTSHINFNKLENLSRGVGLQVLELKTQAEFLIKYGITLRAEILAKANPKILDDVNRLISTSQMGDLFKVIAIQAS